MAQIKVHLLNFHSIFTHIEIMLEDTSTYPPTYYSMNRWANPQKAWSNHGAFPEMIAAASSTFSFMIEAEPSLIMEEWRQYWAKTQSSAGVLGDNCAVATQWFLTKFAKIPEPNLSNVSLNHFAFGIFWPSVIPSPVMLPGRVMSNAKFHIKARENSTFTKQHSNLLLQVAMATAALTLAAATLGVYVAVTVLTGGLAAVAIAACVVVGLAASAGFFSAYNKLSSKRQGEPMKTSDHTKVEIENINQPLTSALAAA